MKRLISLLLALALCMTLSPTALPVQAATKGVLTYTVSNGGAKVTDCSASATGALVIPATLGGYPVTSIGDFAFSWCDSLTSVTIPNGVTSIGDYAFDGCQSLTSITIPESVSSIGDDAFSYCSSLKSITIPDSVTSIGWGTFQNCSSLMSITIPNGVTSIGDSAFYDCNSLTSITIPESVSSIGDAAFSYCSSLKSITIPDSVTSIGWGTFQDCRSLTSVTLPNGVNSIGGDAFSYCSSLKSITIPEGVSSIGLGAFSGCRSLTTITIPKGVTSIGDEAFFACNSLTGIWVSESNPSYASDGYGVLFNKNKTVLECAPGGLNGSYIIPQGVTSIDDYAFSYCSSLKSITIPEGVTSIGDSAFSSCSSLTGIWVSENNPSYASDGYGVLFNKNKTALECAPGGLNGSYIIPQGVTSIGDDAFSHCSSLKSITIPMGVTSIGDSAFYDCNSLTSIAIPESVNSIGWRVFSHCSSLKSITIPEGVASIGGSAFSHCSSLTSITITEGVTIIDYSAFYHCDSLTSIAIPESVNSIGWGAFRNCNGLRNVYYQGTQQQWNGISIDSDNECLTYATIHFSAEIPESNQSIAIFSTEKSLSVKTGDSMWLAFALMDANTEEIETEWEKMAVTVSDPSIIALSDYEKTEYGYSLEVIGKKQGSTNVTITDTKTGVHTMIVISVKDSFVETYSYAIDNMKVFYPSNKWEDHLATNIYNLNGLYVSNYQCTKTGGQYYVEFDVYNSKYYAGAVDIYDKNGMWLGYEEIEKFSDITSLYDTGEQAFFLISNTIALIPGGSESNLLTYKQESFAKHTHISLELSEGDYFTISNNVSTSPGTFFINALEILFDGAYTALDLVTSNSVKTTALSEFKESAAKSFADCLIEARNEGLKNEVKKNAQIIMLNTMQSEITKITEKFAQAQMKDQLGSTEEAYSEMVNLAENILNAYDIEWKHLLQSTVGVTEAAFTTFAGPAGAALKGCFAITESTNKMMMAVHMATSTQKPYVTVYSAIEEGYINPYGVVVNTEGNMDSEAVLQVFRVSDDDAIRVILNSDNPLEQHELYNISFVKNDQLVSPSGNVKVHIPIPKGIKGNTCKVYRQEADGSWAILDAHVEGNYLVFETDHFSLYSIIGDMDSLGVHSLPNKVVYTNGDTLDTTGMVLDLNGELISEGFICEPTVVSGNGNVKITVRYGNAKTDFEVKVYLRGDITGDGNVNMGDISMLYAHIKGTSALTDDNAIARCDVTGDGSVNMGDVSKLYAHIRGTSKLF